MSHTSVQAAATRTQHSGNSERLDPHKRSAQLDFSEKILGVYERARAYGCPGETATKKKLKHWRDKAAKTGSRRKKTKRRRKTTSMKNEDKRKEEEKEKVEGGPEVAEEG